MKILIVEDEPKTGEYLRQGLTEAGYVADLVPHGTDGLHMALQGAYDLVILYVMLPGLNGWQETERAAHAAGSTIEALAAEYRLPADYIRMTIDEPMLDTTINAEEGVEA